MRTSHAEVLVNERTSSWNESEVKDCAAHLKQIEMFTLCIVGFVCDDSSTETESEAIGSRRKALIHNVSPRWDISHCTAYEKTLFKPNVLPLTSPAQIAVIPRQEWQCLCEAAVIHRFQHQFEGTTLNGANTGWRPGAGAELFFVAVIRAKTPQPQRTIMSDFNGHAGVKPGLCCALDLDQHGALDVLAHKNEQTQL